MHGLEEICRLAIFRILIPINSGNKNTLRKPNFDCGVFNISKVVPGRFYMSSYDMPETEKSVRQNFMALCT
jgi:hypothetical protein